MLLEKKNVSKHQFVAQWPTHGLKQAGLNCAYVLKLLRSYTLDRFKKVAIDNVSFVEYFQKQDLVTLTDNADDLIDFTFHDFWLLGLARRPEMIKYKIVPPSVKLLSVCNAQYWHKHYSEELYDHTENSLLTIIKPLLYNNFLCWQFREHFYKKFKNPYGLGVVQYSNPQKIWNNNNLLVEVIGSQLVPLVYPAMQPWHCATYIDGRSCVFLTRWANLPETRNEWLLYLVNYVRSAKVNMRNLISELLRLNKSLKPHNKKQIKIFRTHTAYNSLIGCVSKTSASLNIEHNWLLMKRTCI